MLRPHGHCVAHDRGREQAASGGVCAAMRDELCDGPADDTPWIADAACVDPLEVPDREPLECADARRALIWGVVGVVCLGFVIGPVALAIGHRARLAIADRPELRGAGAARAAIALGKIGFALHLTLAATVIPWLLFMLPLLGG